MMELSLWQVALGLLPILIAALIFGLLLADWTSVAWASLRMFGQLIFIGYALTLILSLQHPFWVLVVVSLMSLGAGWIALRAMRKYKRPIWPVFAAVILAGGLNLLWIGRGDKTCALVQSCGGDPDHRDGDGRGDECRQSMRRTLLGRT